MSKLLSLCEASQPHEESESLSSKKREYVRPEIREVEPTPELLELFAKKVTEQ